MPIATTDIRVYGSQVMPENDTSTNIGGAIDLTSLIVFVDIDIPGIVEVISDNASDTTQTLTIAGRDISGAIITESMQLNGITIVPFAKTFERFMKFTLSGVSSGNVTLRKAGAAGDLAIFPSGVTTIRQPFFAASADASGGTQREFHEKIFIRNDHPTLTLTEAQIVESADTGANISFALETTLNGSDTNGIGNNRLVEPGGYIFNSSAKLVSNSQNHTPLAGQGIWLKLTLPAGAAPAKNTYTISEQGKTI